MLTTSDIVGRYLSDIRYIRQLFENEVITRSAYDEMIDSRDAQLENDLEMANIATPTSELERILQYS